MARNKDKKRRAITQAQKQRRQDKALLPQPLGTPATAPATAEPATVGRGTADQATGTPPVELTGEVRALAGPGAKADATLLLTVSDLCALLRISRASVYRMQKAGTIPGRIDLGGHVRYHRPTIENWLLSRVKE